MAFLAAATDSAATAPSQSKHEKSRHHNSPFTNLAYIMF
jgi:hypothetical protein